MAKNTGASKFRRVDVDQFDDDKFVDDADTEAESAEGANDAEVNNLLAQYPLLTTNLELCLIIGL